MKNLKLFGTLAFAALLFAGCTSDEVNEVNVVDSRNAIQFGVSNKDTRGKDMNIGELQRKGGFGVVAFYTEKTPWAQADLIPNYMYNQHVFWDESSWVYSPLKYWPSREGDKLSFFAYAPFQQTNDTDNKQGIQISSNSKTGAPSLLFTTKSSPAEMVDLVTSVIVDKEKNKDAQKTTIDFKFKHVLSSVQFTCSNKADNSYINIKKAWLTFKDNSNLYKSATYNFANQTDSLGTWSYEEGSKFEGFYDLDGILDIKKNPSKKNSNLGDYSVNGILLNIGEQNKDLFNTAKLFFIPAEGENGLNDKSVSVTFEYDVVTLDPTLPGGYSSTSQVKEFFLEGGTMMMGYSKSFNFDLDADSLDIETEVEK